MCIMRLTAKLSALKLNAEPLTASWCWCFGFLPVTVMKHFGGKKILEEERA